MSEREHSTPPSSAAVSRKEIERGIADGIHRARDETREERQAELETAVAAGVSQALKQLEHGDRKEALKEAYKELAREWLAEISIWTLRAIGMFVVGSLLFAALYFTGIKAGWTPPK